MKEYVPTKSFDQQREQLKERTTYTFGDVHFFSHVRTSLLCFEDKYWY
jgi:hypothetical protein